LIERTAELLIWENQASAARFAPLRSDGNASFAWFGDDGSH